jgi:hypothetical protein
MDDARYKELKAGMDPSVEFKRPYWLSPELKTADNDGVDLMCPACHNFVKFFLRMNIDEGKGPWVCKACAIKHTRIKTGSDLWKSYKVSYEAELEREKDAKEN